MLNVISVKWLLHQAAFFSALGLGRGITRTIPCVSQRVTMGTLDRYQQTLHLKAVLETGLALWSHSKAALEGGVSVSCLTIKEKLSSSVVQGPVRGSSKRDPSVKHRAGMLGRESRWKIWLFLFMLELNSDE